MASLNRRSNPLYAIKECSSCGNLHTKDCGCPKRSLEDKILVAIPDLSQRPLKIEKICLDCGDPVHGPYCRQCALIRKTLEEVFQDFQDTSNYTKEGRRKGITEEQAAEDRYWKIPICYDDDEDYTIAITPVLPTKEPVNSLSMGDEHLDTIPATESDEVIKSSVENLIPIPSESEGISDSVCDVPLCNNPTPLETFKEHSETIIDSNDDSTSSDDDSYENIDYVDASPPDAEIVSLEVVEIVIPEVGGINTDILLTIKDDILREKLLNVNLLIANIEALKDNPALSSDVMTKSSSTSLNPFLEETNTFDNSLTESFCFDLEENSSGSTTTHSDYSLPDYEAFYSDDDHIKEKSSGSTTTHADFSQYDSFIFDLLINPFPPADRSDFYHEEFADELAHIIIPPEYDHFCFKIEPELGNLTMDVVGDIFPTREPRIHVPNVLPTHPTLDTDFILLKMSRIFEASRARGICPSITRASQSSASFGNPISYNLSTNVYL
ncbi:hypothetical protein Tco_0990674 [Tanacetum coccineum]|uniref:Uncharacterized protein n=1 Tax=Tanacetum coccineum TaxID=301880 RepID=A0ABQ5EY98_9ASTR